MHHLSNPVEVFLDHPAQFNQSNITISSFLQLIIARNIQESHTLFTTD